MGLVDKEVVINPTRKQLQHSVLDLVITATQKHKVGELIHCLSLCGKWRHHLNAKMW